MSKEIAYAGQSFLDKIIECTGDIENAFEMSLLNARTITDKLQVATTLKKSAITDYDVVSYFTDNNRPATYVAVIIPTDPVFVFTSPGEFPYSF
ncbi:hypothetical protein [Flavobacterium gilvum]|uniref:Uncharacterized protein n=1 Tax=Flavobacterium gilvum TaxID=1492737 RepID=A0AAC9I3D3_9FLAO|nr:hypothetical protein [Flavobacterium gilvum]AOW08752.1 hypothetical protein EM308_04125 [Flavobacterium gilvum]KFC59807.1 hypothetical protein FEM08_13180 [Flavobacterium gilvum]